ncbi:MAG: mycothiol synthase [Sporichthyaceae bacterium]|nr:mycothiol synthase [Sporichthyaceae bacterium]
MSAPADPDGVTVEVTGRLTAQATAEVRALVAAAADADQVPPLSEHVTLHLRYGGDEPVRTFLAKVGDRIVGYGHLDVTDEVEGASAEVVVDPAYRQHGVGRQLVAHMLAAVPQRRLRLWAHGELPAAAVLARTLGFQRVRALWQMRRSLAEPLPEVVLTDGVTVRTFRPDLDEAGWVELNRRAFADHPEQGKWSIDDLRQRMCEPWFDPSGFFLAERDGRLVGFHWTKIHGGRHGAEHHGHEPIGEIYVIGIDPAEQGSGLGTALSIIGLEHLRSQHLAEAMLYVEADNSRAIKVYEKLGFSHADTDVMYRHVPEPTSG